MLNAQQPAHFRDWLFQESGRPQWSQTTVLRAKPTPLCGGGTSILARLGDAAKRCRLERMVSRCSSS
jgi:hypothetical protein